MRQSENTTEKEFQFSDVQQATSSLEASGLKVDQVSENTYLVYPSEIPGNYPDNLPGSDTKPAIAELSADGLLRLCNDTEPLMATYHAQLLQMIQGARELIAGRHNFSADTSLEADVDIHKLCMSCTPSMISIIRYAAEVSEFTEKDVKNNVSVAAPNHIHNTIHEMLDKNLPLTFETHIPG